MRRINFKVRNIGSEKYLSYVLDDDCDFDEELLDYLEDNNIAELIDIIYEEDDENDYLTYNVTGRATVDSLLTEKVNAEKMLGIIRGVASGIVNMRDLGIPVSYVVLHRAFTYVNPVTYDVKMLCVPVETDTNINAEFRYFVKHLIMDATYSDDEDCNYVAKIINMLNADKFAIRTFLGQITELMEAAGMIVDDEFTDIDGTGVEVSQGAGVAKADTTMEDLPDVGDVSFDEEDDDLDMYEEEPSESNTIFKDLDLDSDEPKKDGINMDVFDDSVLQELEIDEDAEYDFSSEEESAEEDSNNYEGLTEMLSSEELAETAEEDNSEAEVPEQAKESFAIKDTKKTDEDIIGSAESGIPTLIDTDDLDNLIDEPPVVKSIRINRAKIIQKAVSEIDDNIADNPTEQIIGDEFINNKTSEPVLETVESDQPERTVEAAEANAKTEEKQEVQPHIPTGNTVELTEGMNVVKDTEAEIETKPAPGVPKAMPYIVRVNTGERVMINKAAFKLGKASRGVDFSISGNGAISRVHAIIYQREDGCYIKDNKATNSTYVNNVKLEENQEMLLKNDATIVLGGEEFLFKLS